jgi:hypothetical protein
LTKADSGSRPALEGEMPVYGNWPPEAGWLRPNERKFLVSLPLQQENLEFNAKKSIFLLTKPRNGAIINRQ